jgi:hypothetical protein
MARYWLRVRAEYVVPVLATSREDAMSLDAGDLVDEMTPDRLYSSELLSAVPDSERRTYDCAGLHLDAEQRAEDDWHAAMLEIGARVRASFCDVFSLPPDHLRDAIVSAIAGWTVEVAESVLHVDIEDRETRLPALIERIRGSATASANTYLKWRTQ